MTYEKGDIVVFKLSRNTKETYNGVVVSKWTTAASSKNYVYEISSMNHGMNSFTIGQQCILKKIS